MIGKKTLQTQRNLFDPQRSHHYPLEASRWGNIKRQNNLKFSRELRQNVSFGIGGFITTYPPTALI